MVVATLLLIGNQSFSACNSASQRLSPADVISTSSVTAVSLPASNFTGVEATATPPWRILAVAFIASLARIRRRIRTISPR